MASSDSAIKGRVTVKLYQHVQQQKTVSVDVKLSTLDDANCRMGRLMARRPDSECEKMADFVHLERRIISRERLRATSSSSVQVRHGR